VATERSHRFGVTAGRLHRWFSQVCIVKVQLAKNEPTNWCAPCTAVALEPQQLHMVPPRHHVAGAVRPDKTKHHGEREP